MENFVIEPKEYKTVTIGFNPANLKSFDSIYGVIIWCCIRTCHIVDEGFDDAVSFYSTSINKLKLPDNYLKFRDSITSSLKQYGTKDGYLDDSFWLMVYRLLENPELFTFKLNDKEYSLNNETIRLFKVENYI